MDKDLLLQNTFQAAENIKTMRSSVDKGFNELLEKNLAQQQRFTICCKAKDLNKELARLEPVIEKILS